MSVKIIIETIVYDKDHALGGNAPGIVLQIGRNPLTDLLLPGQDRQIASHKGIRNARQKNGKLGAPGGAVAAVAAVVDRSA